VSCSELQCVAERVYLAIGTGVERDHVKVGYVAVRCSELQQVSASFSELQ